MPDLEASIWQTYKDQGVLVYGVHFGESAKEIADFIAQTGITFPVLSDQGSFTQLAFPQGVGYPYPRDVIIGKDLTIRSIKNSFNPDDTDALVQQLLAE